MQQQDYRRGLLAGVGAYTIWGLVPVYFKLLAGIAPVEVVAQRILWSLVLLIAVLAVLRRMPLLRAVFADRRLLLTLAASAALIAANWLIYIWAVVTGHLLAASLGYFLNPLLNVALGVVVLGERLSGGQKVAIALAGLGVAIAAAGALSQIWVSVALAISFGLYGLIRKQAPVGAIEGLAAETILLAPLCLAYLWSAHGHGGLGFGRDQATDWLLIGSSVVTSLPLVMFAFAAKRLPYATVGVLQYIAPSMVFVLGIFAYGEALRPAMLAAFVLIWIGLIVFTRELLLGLKRA